MKSVKRRIESGLYLVIDPTQDKEELLKKLSVVLSEKIVALQIWDHFIEGEVNHALINEICSLAMDKSVPVLINNRWELFKDSKLSGIHFDVRPENWDQIKLEVGEEAIVGLTCENNLEDVVWAAENNLDYISFCSIFPSSTVASCEIVSFETVKKARKIFQNTLFLAGGIYPERINELEELQYNGVAVISGVMSAENPLLAVEEYYKKLKL